MKSKKRIRWMKIIKIMLIAFPSIVFGILTIIFSLQQNSFTKMIREQDQKQTDELNIRIIFQNYINDISKLLFKNFFNQTNSEHLLHIRVKTLTALNYLDPNRKRDIILFLYEMKLLRSDINKLDLTGANLSDIQFIGSLNSPLQLDYLYLSGIKGTNLTFKWCQLKNAVFDYSYMPNLKLINVAITNSSFKQIYASDGIMHNVIFHRNNFSGSILSRTHLIINVYLRRTIDFTNADLINVTLTFDDIQMNLTENLMDSLIIIRNTRLPNGLFYYIDSSDLVIDGGAQQACQSNRSDVQSWIPNGDIPVMNFSNLKIDSTLSIPFEENNCYFLSQLSGESSLVQLINLKSYSVLIDSHQGRFNISAYLGCIHRKYANISIILTFLSDNAIPSEQFIVITTMNNPNVFINIDTIPPLTRFIYLSLHSYSTEIHGFCIIDNIQFRIFKHEENIPTNYLQRIFHHHSKRMQ